MGNPDADSRLTGILILTHIDRSGGKFNFENDPYFPKCEKFGFCGTSANITDFYAKMTGKCRHYSFGSHLNNWNSYPWNPFSWKPIFEVTPPNMAIFENPKIRNFWISTKNEDHHLSSLQIWSKSDTNSRNASHLKNVVFIYPSR